jgi:hypothetical protein
MEAEPVLGVGFELNLGERDGFVGAVGCFFWLSVTTMRMRIKGGSQLGRCLLFGQWVLNGKFWKTGPLRAVIPSGIATGDAETLAARTKGRRA